MPSPLVESQRSRRAAHVGLCCQGSPRRECLYKPRWRMSWALGIHKPEFKHKRGFQEQRCAGSQMWKSMGAEPTQVNESRIMWGYRFTYLLCTVKVKFLFFSFLILGASFAALFWKRDWNPLQINIIKLQKQDYSNFLKKSTVELFSDGCVLFSTLIIF